MARSTRGVDAGLGGSASWIHHCNYGNYRCACCWWESALRFRSFHGANKALPVLASSLLKGGSAATAQLDLERRDITIDDVCREAAQSDLVVFAGCMTPQWPEIDVHVKRVHQALQDAGRSDVALIVGGYAAKSAEDIVYASPWITGLFDGEGESAICEIAAAVAAGRFMDQREALHGLCFIGPDGTFRRSTAPRVKDFDDIDQGMGLVHVPEVHDMEIFRGPDGRQLKTAQIFTQRGCPWECGYCNKSTEGNSVVRL